MSIRRKFLLAIPSIGGIIFFCLIIVFLQGGFSTGRYWLYPWEIWYLVPQAENGDIDAAKSLRFHYEFRNDKGKTRYWLRKGAEYGDPEAQLALFNSLKDIHDPSLEKEAKESLQKAADRGYGWAQVQLADEYLEGTFLPRSNELAEIWLRKASYNGSLAGMHKLSVLLPKIRSDQRALTEAYMWTVIGLSRIKPDVTLADYFREQQKSIMDKASRVGIAGSAISQSAEYEAAVIEKSIRRDDDE